MRSFAICAALALGAAAGQLPAPVAAATVGQPMIVMDAGLSGSLLDFFYFGMPSGMMEATLSGQVTAAYGWPGMIGDTMSFHSDVTDAVFLSFASDTTPRDYAVFPAPFVPGGGGLFIGGITAGPGDLNFGMLVSPDYVETDLGGGLYSYDYGGIFAPFSGRTGAFPEFELILSVYLGGPLPTKTFEYTEYEGGPIISLPYIEGPLDITRMTLGLKDGAPIRVPEAVPLPAGLPLLAAALGAFGLLRRRRTAAPGC